MSAEFMVACLWGAVLAYWLWTRRPFGGDSIGSFRHELQVLESATPMRVSPAHRLSPVSGALRDLGVIVSGTSPASGSYPGPGPLVGARHGHGTLPLTTPVPARRQAQAVARRRRCMVLAVLAATSGLSALAAVAERSAPVVFLQLALDLGLVAYVGLLLLTTRATRDAAARQAKASARHQQQTFACSGPLQAAGASGEARARGPVPAHARLGWAQPPLRPVDIDLTNGPEGAHVVKGAYAGEARGAHVVNGQRARARWAVPVEDETEPYGDFASYASLALAQAN